MKKDIENEEDIKLLVDTFYDSVIQDNLLGPIFNDFAKVDWTSHLPVMYSFWNTVLLGSMSYKGQPFPKHLSLPIKAIHFSRWVELFNSAVDTLYSGVKAEEAKQKASSIAHVFKMKMSLYEPLSH